MSTDTEDRLDQLLHLVESGDSSLGATPLPSSAGAPRRAQTDDDQETCSPLRPGENLEQALITLNAQEPANDTGNARRLLSLTQSLISNALIRMCRELLRVGRLVWIRMIELT